MENQDQKPQKSALWACIASLGAALLSIFILFAPVLNYETKYYVGDEKVKEYFSLNMVDLFDNSKYYAWQMIIIVVVFALAAILAISLFYLTKKMKDSKITNGVAVTMTFAFLIGFISLFLNKEIFSNYAYNSETKFILNFNGASLGWGSAVAMFASMVGAFAGIGCSNYAQSRNVKSIAEDGILLAAAFVLNFLKLPIAASGGSINFQMLPLMIIALRRGPLDGFVAGGIVYGLLTCLTDGYGFATYPFDYLIGFGSVAAMGFFRKFIFSPEQKTYNVKGILFLILGGAIATTIRFIGGCASSMAIYGYQLVPAMAYNAVYVYVSGAIALAAVILLYAPLIKINALFPAAKLTSSN